MGDVDQDEARIGDKRFERLVRTVHDRETTSEHSQDASYESSNRTDTTTIHDDGTKHNKTHPGTSLPERGYGDTAIEPIWISELLRYDGIQDENVVTETVPHQLTVGGVKRIGYVTLNDIDNIATQVTLDVQRLQQRIENSTFSDIANEDIGIITIGELRAFEDLGHKAAYQRLIRQSDYAEPPLYAVRRSKANRLLNGEFSGSDLSRAFDDFRETYRSICQPSMLKRYE